MRTRQMEKVTRRKDLWVVVTDNEARTGQERSMVD